MERPARVLTWAADEHVLGVIAGGLWLAARAGNERERRQTDHLGRSEAQRRGGGHDRFRRWNFGIFPELACLMRQAYSLALVGMIPFEEERQSAV